MTEMVQLVRGLIKGQDAFLRKMQRNSSLAENVTFNWLMTYAGRDGMTFAIALVTGLLPDSRNRAVVISQLEAMAAYFVQADTDKDRKPAASVFEKQLRRVLRRDLKGTSDDDIEALVESASTLTSPPYKRFSDAATPRKQAGRAPGWHATAVAQQSHSPVQAPAPMYYQQPQPVAFASPTQPACPPGYKLTAIAPASASATPPGGGRAPPRGIASTKPTEVFPPSHFVRPCAYCSHANHTGDHCWSTYPTLRALNGRS
jgi:hypothetical protein